MSEIPIQIDLSNDASWDQIKDEHLTQEEKNLLKEHFTEEHEGIIYLTQEEIQSLRNIVQAQVNSGISPVVQNAMSGELDEFIENQKVEGLVISDFVITPEDYPESLQFFFESFINGGEDIMRDQLFGDQGIFSSLDISPIAQDRMSVAMGLSFMDYGTKELLVKIQDGELSPEDISEMLVISNAIETRFATIKAVMDATVHVPGSTSTTMSNVYVAGNGEGNSIFMNPLEAIEFSNRLILGDIDEGNIKDILESANGEVDENQEIDFLLVGTSINNTMGEMMEQLDTLTLEQLQALDSSLDSLAQSGVSPDESTDPKNDDPSKKSILERFFEMLQELVTGFIDLGEEAGFIPSESDDGEGDKDSGQAVEIAPTRVDTIRNSILSRLNEGSFSGIQDEGIKTFLEGEGNTEQVISIMGDIPTYNGQDTLEEKIDNLFFSDIDSGENNKFTDFIEAGTETGTIAPIKDANGVFDSENFIEAITNYKEYRIAHSQDNSLTFRAYFESLN